MTKSTANTKLPGPIRLFFVVDIFLVALCSLIELFCRYVLHMSSYVYLKPLFIGLKYNDFNSFRERFLDLHTQAFFAIDKPWPFAYPPAAAIPYAFFFSYRAHSLAFFLGTSALVLLCIAVLFGFALRRSGLAPRTAALVAFALLALSYPVGFVLQRANMELVTFFILTLGVWCFCRGRGYFAAACFGVAGSMKIFPLIYLGLLLSQRKYREFLVGLGTAAAATVLSLRFIGPTISAAWHGIQQGMAAFHDAFLLKPRPIEFGYDHSLNGLYRRFATLPDPATLSHDLNVYLLTAAIVGTALFFLRIRYMPTINQVLSLAVAAILLPPTSFDYTLIHLYVPLGMLMLFSVGLERKGESASTIPGVNAMFVCLALLVAPESELIWQGVRVAAQFKCLVLVVLFLLAVRYPVGDEGRAVVSSETRV